MLALKNVSALNSLTTRIGYSAKVIELAKRVGRLDAVRTALRRRCVLDQHVGVGDIDACVSHVDKELAKYIEPGAIASLVDTDLSPLFLLRGGRMTNLLLDLHTVFLLSMSAHLVESLSKFKKEGPQQEADFRALLGSLLDIHAVQHLASQHCTETPMESAESDALRVAKQLGDLSHIERVQVLFQNVLTSPFNPKKKMLSSSSEDKESYDKTEYDTKSQAKGFKQRVQTAGLGCVVVHLLQNEERNPAGKPLRKVHLGTDKAENGVFHVRGRATQVFADPSPQAAYGAIHDILDKAQSDIAPKMTNMLNESQKPYLFVATARAGKPTLHKVGRKGPRFKTPIDNELLHYGVVDSQDNFPRWVQIGDLDKNEAKDLVLPPFEAHKPGVLNVYVLPADDSSLPAARLDLEVAHKMTNRLDAHGPAGAARQNAEVAFRIQAYSDTHAGKNPHNRKKRKLDAVEDKDLQRVCRAAYDAAHAKRMRELQAKPRKRIRVTFDPRQYPTFHKESDARAEDKQRAIKEREELCKRGRDWLHASEENAKVAKCHPGGEDYLAAMDAFVANVTSTD